MAGGSAVLRVGSGAGAQVGVGYAVDVEVGRKGSSYAGGPGTDHVNMWAGRSLDLDLRSGRRVTKKSGHTVRNRLTGFETQLVGAKKLVLEGTKKADELRFYACQAIVKGRGGADGIRQSGGDDYFEAGLLCNPRRFRLVGGPGRETINGNRGRDTCSGEKLGSCEVRRRGA